MKSNSSISMKIAVCTMIISILIITDIMACTKNKDPYSINETISDDKSSDDDSDFTSAVFGYANQQGLNIIRTTDNEYIVNGVLLSSGDAYIIKIDHDLNLLWEKTFDGKVSSIMSADDNGFFMVGSKANGTNSDVWLIKCDTDGNTEWEKTYDFGDNEKGLGISMTEDQGYVITGYGDRNQYPYLPDSTAYRSKDLLTMKLDKSADTIWTFWDGIDIYDESG